MVAPGSFGFSCRKDHKRRAMAKKLRAEGMSYKQIGEHLGVTQSTAYYLANLKAQKNTYRLGEDSLHRSLERLDINGILKELDEGKFD